MGKKSMHPVLQEETSVAARPVEKVGIILAMAGALALGFGLVPVITTKISSFTSTTYPCAAIDFQALAWEEGVSLSTKAASLQQSIDEATETLREQYVTKAPAATILETLQVRKRLLARQLYRDPSAAATASLTEADRSALRKYPNCVEQPVNVTGTLQVTEYDDFDGQRGYTQYQLQDAQGTLVNVYPGHSRKKPLEPHDVVRVSGYALDGAVYFRDDAVEPLTPEEVDQQFPALAELKSVPDNANGPMPTLVLLLNYSNTNVSLPTPETTLLRMSENKAFHLENSYGSAVFQGVNNPDAPADVYGWFTIDEPQQCSTPSWPVYNAAKAAYPEINFQNYKHVVLIAPMGPDCGFSAFSTLGIANHATPDGLAFFSQTSIVNTSSRTQVIAHELGHGFGAFHANWLPSLDWIQPEVDDSAEYGDVFSIMGHYSTAHHNVLHKDLYGWLTNGRATVAAEDGTYTIHPQEDAVANLKLLKLQRRQNEFFYLEYRQPIGFDANLSYFSSDVFEGGLLYLPGSTIWSLLVDGSSPPLSDPYSAALKPGMTITDPVAKHTITAVSANTDGLTVQVDLGKTDFTPPEISLTGVEDGAYVTGALSLEAMVSDSSGIQQVAFYHSRSTEPFAVETAEPYTAQLDTSLLADGGLELRVEAIDLSGQAIGAENNTGTLTYDVVVANMEPVLPQVTIVSPVAGAVVTNPTIITADVTPGTHGIKKVEFLEGEVVISTAIAPDYTYSWEPNPGAHTVTVRVQDYLGGVALSSVTFTVRTQVTTFSVEKVSNSSGVDWYPDVSNEAIVWEDDSSSDIHQYRFDTQQASVISSATYRQEDPAVFGSYVVWKDQRDFEHSEVYAYNGSTQTTQKLTTNFWAAYPAVNGQYVVWQNSIATGNTDIYRYNRGTGQVQAIVTNSSYQKRPDISTTHVVYEDFRNGNWDIYAYNLSTQAETRLTTNPSTQQIPRVSGSTVVYQDNRNGDWDIYAYNLVQGTETKLTGPGNQQHPDVSGRYLVYDDDRNGSTPNVYRYDLQTGDEELITTNGYWPRIHEGNIVWFASAQNVTDVFHTSFSYSCTDGTSLGHCTTDGQVCTLEGAQSCNDGNSCTTDSCPTVGGTCQYTPVVNDCGSKECGTSLNGCYSCGTCSSSEPFCAPSQMCEAKCQDGTPFGSCSASSQYCDNGTLENNCLQCGYTCPSYQPYCAEDGSCVQACADGTPVNSCNGGGLFCDWRLQLVSDCNYCGATCPAETPFCSWSGLCVALCTDGTPEGECNYSTQQYCTNGTLTENCLQCGCPFDRPYCDWENQDPICQEKCWDGTVFGQCNADGLYCSNGWLQSNCNYCGATCPSNTPYCSADGTCRSVCSDGTVDGQCNASGQKCMQTVLVNSCEDCLCPSTAPYCNTQSKQCEAKCTDGTSFNTCNASNRYCENGTLLPLRCDKCSQTCPATYTCTMDGQCCKPGALCVYPDGTVIPNTTDR